MAIHLRERSSSTLGLLLGGSLVTVVVFGALFASMRDWWAGAFALIAAIFAVRLATLQFRLSRSRATRSLQPSSAERTAIPPTDAEMAGVFSTGARHVVGARYREGTFAIAREVAAFIPTTDWRHLAAEIGLGLLGHRANLSEIEIHAEGSPSLAKELADLAGHHGGFLVGDDWSWVLRGKALAPGDRTATLTINDSPPAADIERWAVLPPAPAAEKRRILRRVLTIGGGVAAVFAGAGVVTWRLTGNADFLIAGLGWAGVIVVAVAAGLILARRLASQ